jgi:putative Mg2+ transporter-C (MgtC) family protein
VAPTISTAELVLRLGVTLILCATIGLEREIRGQIAGLRTHILVGLGAALFTLVSAYGFSDFVEPNPAGGFVTTFDPTRIAAQIVTGIGFLGAGAIIRQGLAVRGLTTAAALWMAAAIGMAAGAGYYVGAAVATAAVLGSLIGFRRLRPWLMTHLRSDIVFLDLSLSDGGALSRVYGLLGSRGIGVNSMYADREEDGLAYRLELRLPPGVTAEPILAEVETAQGVETAELHRTRLAD